MRHCTIRVAKTKALISCAVTVQSLFSHKQTNFGQMLSICSQDIKRKQNSDVN